MYTEYIHQGVTLVGLGVNEEITSSITNQKTINDKFKNVNIFVVSGLVEVSLLLPSGTQTKVFTEGSRLGDVDFVGQIPLGVTLIIKALSDNTQIITAPLDYKCAYVALGESRDLVTSPNTFLILGELGTVQLNEQPLTKYFYSITKQVTLKATKETHVFILSE